MSSPRFVNSQQSRDRFSPLLGRFCKLPSLQLRNRCQELQTLFNHYNYKELIPFFPRLLQDIFSHNQPTGWSLNLLQDTRYNHWHDVRLRTKDNVQSDFKIVRDFLSPAGPMFDLIYKMQADPTVRFDFPTEFLPAPTKDSMKQGAVPQFYLNKLSYLDPNNLQLSAFDIYMFYFSYFLISLQSEQHLQNACVLENSVYTSLIEDYLNYFLPLGGRRVPPMPYTGASPAYNQSGGVSQTRPIHGGVLWCYLQSGGQQKQARLLRDTSIQRSTSVIHSDSHLESLGHENWRSEVMIEVFVEFWLNQNSLYYDQKSFTQQVRANVLPSQDLVRIVRMLIKHLHYFANSAKDVVHSAYYQTEDPLEELKRFIIPLIVQSKLYAFFRHGFDRWPLDSSFRLMLETWLSFIQPWRYVQPPSDRDDKDSHITDASKKFVAENLHFYTVLFQEYLQRALRHDLAAPKNAQMLFRVSKVFSQSDLRAVLEKVEHNAVDHNGIHVAKMSNTQLIASGSFVTSSSPSASTTSILQQVKEQEGPSFRYKPMFGFECRQSIEQLFKSISQVKLMLHNHEDGNNRPHGFFAWVSGLAVDNVDSESRAKVESYLEYSEACFDKIFQMEGISHITSMVWGTPTRGSEHQTPDMSGGELSPLGRYQVANGLRKLNITYNGNPDLQPIRTYENKCLVRYLHKLSTWLNQVFGEEIQDLWFNDGFMGALAYQYIQPPYQQSTCHNETFHLPDNHPRICLRFLASYRTILYLLIFFLALFWMDFSLIGAVLVLFVILVMYGVVGACIKTMSKQQLSHID